MDSKTSPEPTMRAKRARVELSWGVSVEEGDVDGWGLATPKAERSRVVSPATVPGVERRAMEGLGRGEGMSEGEGIGVGEGVGVGVGDGGREAFGEGTGEGWTVTAVSSS